MSSPSRAPAFSFKTDDVPVELELIRNEPDEAGPARCGPSAAGLDLKGYDGILAVDVGGNNIRAGIVELNISKSADLSKARVGALRALAPQRRGREARRCRGTARRDAERPARLGQARQAVAGARDRGRLPRRDPRGGSIARGAQNLPGNWESSRFNLPASIAEHVPRIGDHETLVVMHNDAVVQGLSELP